MSSWYSKHKGLETTLVWGRLHLTNRPSSLNDAEMFCGGDRSSVAHTAKAKKHSEGLLWALYNLQSKSNLDIPLTKLMSVSYY